MKGEKVQEHREKIAFNRGKKQAKQDFEKLIDERITFLKKGCKAHCGYRVDEEKLEKVSVKCGDVIKGFTHLGTECKNRIKDLEGFKAKLKEKK